ncbi:MAG: type I glyceraldehyde-3-phosphate dehydrogenase [Candidatus Marinamargulisbacteria bacterium]
MKIAINGFGRIGRNVFRIVQDNPKIDVVAINDLTDPKTLAHLLKYDSVHGRFNGTISVDGDTLTVNGRSIKIYSERNPSQLPWDKLNVDVAVESTGVFTTGRSDRGGYLSHIDAGAKKVILTVPAKDTIDTMVLGVNDADYRDDCVAWSNASCTTNCLAPIAKVLHDSFGISRGFMNTVHAYTNDQSILDLPHSDLRRARAAAVSIIPTSTGAAKAVSLVIPELKGKLDGMAMRVPTPDGSVVDLVAEVNQDVTKEDVNAALKAAAMGPMKGILDYSEEPLVSVDIIGNPHSSVVDGLCTMANGRLIKVVSWYDNEYGYSNRVVDLVQKISHG